MKKEKSLTKSRLRIIALRPITPVNCDENVMAMVRSIQKKVFGSDWMYFYSGYKLTDIPDMVCGDDGDMLPALLGRNSCQRIISVHCFPSGRTITS